MVDKKCEKIYRIHRHDDINLQNSIISRAEETLYKRIQGLVSAYELRQMSFFSKSIIKTINFRNK